MANQTNGVLGGFIGKMGPAVGYRWKNIWCVRSHAEHIRNPRTEAQQEHRSLFKQEVQLAGRMRWAVNIGLKEISDQMDMTAQNLFVKANQKAFSLVDGLLEVDYANLCISAGSVAPVAVTEVVRGEGDVLTVSFEKNPLRLSADAYDNVYFWIWCPDAQEGYLCNPVYRRARRMSVVLPETMEGKAVHVYAFVQDENGRCSNTAYGAVDSVAGTDSSGAETDAETDSSVADTDSSTLLTVGSPSPDSGEELGMEGAAVSGFKQGAQTPPSPPRGGTR